MSPPPKKPAPKKQAPAQPAQGKHATGTHPPSQAAPHQHASSKPTASSAPPPAAPARQQAPRKPAPASPASHPAAPATPPVPPAPSKEPRVPTLDEVLERYRESRLEFAALDESSLQKDAIGREQHLIRAYLAAFKVVEGAVYYETARQVTGIANPAALNFFDALDHLARPANIPKSWVDELKSLRAIRNQIEHGGGLLPRVGTLDQLISLAERLLIEILHVSRESLEHDLPPKKPSPTARASDWPAVFEILVDPAQAETRLNGSIAQGIERLRESQKHADRLVETLATDARQILALAARSLWDARLRTDGPLPDDYKQVDDFLVLEKELVDAARRGERIDPAKLRLHIRRVGLCQEAGWLVHEGDKLRFASELVPALVLGSELAPSADALSQLLESLAVDPLWGLSLQASIRHSPQTAPAWLQLLQDRVDPTTLLAEIIAHAYILGALDADTELPDAELARARDLALHGLLHLGPRKDRTIAWALTPKAFWSSILCLASASSVLRERLPEQLGPMPTRLSTIVHTIALEPALAEDQARALTALATPWWALRKGHFTRTESVVAQGFYSETVIHEGHPLIPWVLSLVAPIALENDAIDLLTGLEHGDFGALLVQTPKSRPSWIDAWSRILSRDPERAVGLWLRVLREQLVPAASLGDWSTELLRPVSDRLRAAHKEEDSRQAVRSELLTWTFPEQSTDHHRSLFEWVAPRQEDWEAGLEHWKTTPSLSWALLRDCGAPHSILARWALHFLKEQSSVSPAFRDGPVGIVAGSNVRPVQAGPWKAAFQEAREFLDWLLEHGDKDALHLIADVSLAPALGEAEFDIPYIFEENTRMWFSIGQIFWQGVLHREAGRAVLYERLADGKYVGVNCWPIFDWGWILEIVGENRTLLAEEAPRVFDAYVRFCSVDWQRPKEVRHDQPWEHPPPNIWPNTHTAMLMLAAWSGLLVLDEWRRVVVRYRDARSMTHSGPNLAKVFSILAAKHPDGVASAAPGLPDELLGALCVDGTEAFWRTWHNHVGPAAFIERIDALPVNDLGTGVITTLLGEDRTALAGKLSEPRYFAPFLRVVQDPAIHRDEQLRRILWGTPRDVAALQPLLKTQRGPWLDALLELSATWPPEPRRAALIRLATRSTDPEVRKVCIAALSSPAT